MNLLPHGVGTQEIPTSYAPPAPTTAGLVVAFGAAPIHMASDENAMEYVNNPQLCYTYQEAVQKHGFSDDFEKYPLCETIKSHFSLFNVCPIVLVNVLDPSVHKTAVAETDFALEKGIANLGKDVLKNTLKVKNGDTEVKNENGADYSLTYDGEGNLLLTALKSGALENVATIKVSFDRIAPTAVDEYDIIGGIDVNTGDYEGLELVNAVWPRFRLLPGTVIAPKWGEKPAVAAVIKAKVANVNAHFQCLGAVDIPSNATGADNYQKVAAWKDDNNYVSERLITCWPQIELGEERYRLSTQLSSLMCQVDAGNGDIPYESPSNKNLQMNGMVLADGRKVSFGPEIANYLNANGVVTALNFAKGWCAWGNRTSIYPSSTDVKDTFIPIRRMIDYLNNKFILTMWQEVDKPMTRRLVKRIVNSWNYYLNGLTSREYILGGRLVFLEDENPLTDLIDGKMKFHHYIAPPSPAEHILSIVEFDPEYFRNLFAA